MNYKNTIGSGLLLLMIIILVISYSINEHKLAIWQQKKVLNIEKIKLQSIERENFLLKQAVDKLCSYKLLDDIPTHRLLSTSSGNFSFRLIHRYNQPYQFIHHCDKYNIYYIDININSRIDLNKLDKYHKKRYLYVMICEYIQDNSSSGQGVSMIKVFPVSNVL